MGSQIDNSQYSGVFSSGRDQFIGSKFDVRSGNVYFGSSDPSTDTIDNECLRALNCPIASDTKARLKESKDQLLRRSFDWVLNDAQYTRWKDSEDVGLLRIRGGAGKGKTMMSIGLIEELSRQANVIYFFCQRDNHALNTVEAIIKGLIYQLIDLKEAAKPCLRRRWNTVERRFSEDTDSWQKLWDLFMEMLERCLRYEQKCSCSKEACSCQRIYIIVDALDECVDNKTAALLKKVIRTGLHRPKLLKWLLTSRLSQDGEQVLSVDEDQLHLSLELNSEHISCAVKNYIQYKVAKLDKLSYGRRYGPELCQSVEDALSQKAGDTFLWISLMCQKLETIEPKQALNNIRNSPSTLTDFYNESYQEICYSENSVTDPCLRLLWAMVHAFRPLHTDELSSVIDFPDDTELMRRLVYRCSSFIQLRNTVLEFVHQSARDYLVGTHSLSLQEFSDYIGHQDMGYRCLDSLSQRLQLRIPISGNNENAMDSPYKRTREDLALNYAIKFWFQHVYAAKGQAITLEDPLGNGQVGSFLQKYLLEWIQHLALLGQLPLAVEVLQTLAELNKKAEPSPFHFITFVQHARNFLSRYYQDISCWPQHIHQLATAFNPATSMVRQKYLSRRPTWLASASRLEMQNRGGVEGDVLAIGRLSKRQPGLVKDLVISWGGKAVALGCTDGTTETWFPSETGSRRSSHDLLHGSALIAVSSNGKLIAKRLYGEIEIQHSSGWRYPTYRKIPALSTILFEWWERLSSEVKTLAPSATGLFVCDESEKIIALAANNEVVEVYTESWRYPKISLGRYPSKDDEVPVSPTGGWQLSDIDKTLIVFANAKTRETKLMERAPEPGKIITFSSSEDGHCFIIGNDRNVIEIWRDRDIYADNQRELKCLHLIHIDKDFPLFATNSGTSTNEVTALNKQSTGNKDSQHFFLSGQWICRGERRLLLIPAELKVRCFTSNGVHVAIACEGGDVYAFAFDLEKLE